MAASFSADGHQHIRSHELIPLGQADAANCFNVKMKE